MNYFIKLIYNNIINSILIGKSQSETKSNNEFNFVKCHTAHSIRDQYDEEKSKQLGGCDSCRACWNDKVDVIYYEVH